MKLMSSLAPARAEVDAGSVAKADQNIDQWVFKTEIEIDYV